MAGQTQLEKLRGEIDKIDDAMQDLLIKRAEAVERVAALKHANSMTLLRPAREAEILRRLMSRHHGRFPKAVMVRLWREIISAMLSLEGPQSVAVYMPDRGAGYMELARDQYGAYTPMTAVRSPGQVVRLVGDGDATVGIVPMPDREDVEPWWISLMGESPNLPRIIARLPFSGPGPGRGEGVQALAIAMVSPEPTGYDRSWIALETPPDVSRARMRSVLSASGLEPTLLTPSQIGDTVWRHLVEISGLVAPGDRRLARLVENKQPIINAVILGGYPVPLSAEDLAE